MPPDQGLELASHVIVSTESQIGLDARLERGKAQFLETAALVSSERLRELGECGAPPKRKRAPQELRCLRRLSL